ncbi:hypothetical protein CDIK_1910 [Cucumispora dikerogammari]|nr:hypothetical protein CDIK_1910 [Cucumispora dikerogammari]
MKLKDRTTRLKLLYPNLILNKDIENLSNLREEIKQNDKILLEYFEEIYHENIETFPYDIYPLISNLIGYLINTELKQKETERLEAFKIKYEEHKVNVELRKEREIKALKELKIRKELERQNELKKQIEKRELEVKMYEKEKKEIILEENTYILNLSSSLREKILWFKNNNSNRGVIINSLLDEEEEDKLHDALVAKILGTDQHMHPFKFFLLVLCFHIYVFLCIRDDEPCSI